MPSPAKFRTSWLIERDYNRTLPAPVRLVRVGMRAVYEGLRGTPGFGWAVLVATVLLGLALIPFDGTISRTMRAIKPGGDLRRELEALQQYGQFSVSVLAAIIILLVDRVRARRLLDWLVAMGIAALAVNVVKMFVGRPRPKFDDPLYFLWPFGEYPIDEKVGVRHAWEVWADISSDLWSMPSSHTVYAVVMSVVLTRMYPRIMPLAVALAALVGVCRVWFGAHYPSDVVVGAGLGFVVAHATLNARLGQRLFAERPVAIDGGERADDRRPYAHTPSRIESGVTGMTVTKGATPMAPDSVTPGKGLAREGATA